MRRYYDTFLSFFATLVLQNVKRILLTRGTRTFTKMNLVLLESREMIVATHAHKKLTHTWSLKWKWKIFRIMILSWNKKHFVIVLPKKLFDDTWHLLPNGPCPSISYKPVCPVKRLRWPLCALIVANYGLENEPARNGTRTGSSRFFLSWNFLFRSALWSATTTTYLL